jgi:dTDP-4-dehydrorhamnose 3,5-epimerase
MRFEQTPVTGAWLVHAEVHGDDRGSFARAFDADEFADHGLEGRVVQANLAETRHAGTFRGLHGQRGDAAETKLIRCTRGAILDVVVDVDPDSSTYLGWHGVELSPESWVAMYVPRHCLHGYLSLTDDTQVHYFTSAPYSPAAEWGARFDDPAIGIELPAPVRFVSEKDRSWPDLVP